MRILVIDTLTDSRKSLVEILNSIDHFEVTQAGSAQEVYDLLGIGKDTVAQIPLDLIVLDMELSPPGGLAACRIIKESNHLKDIPIIILIGDQGVDSLASAFAFGAIDYVRKPVEKMDLLTRVHSGLRLKEEIDIRKAREQELLEVTKKLASANQILRRMAFLDGLTGIANRRFFDEIFQKEWRRAARSQSTIALILIDIDFFKLFNDIYGHQAGDECLKQVAKTLEASLKRPGDHAIRYGGEEFAVILAEETNLEGTLKVAENLRINVATLEIPHLGNPAHGHVTISVGVALVQPEDGTLPQSLVMHADKALYEAKHQGRNRVIVAAD
ncbi:MAG: diguanylate cyclase [Nitrospirae bacterium]|nr:diguanylate cyclase [Magnetococcales bacterium]HAT48774.1 diguanylate cyclase response regulator [Alphaproteobacteria bacterium]